MNHATYHQYGQKSCICIHRCFSACPIARMHLIFRYFHTWRQIWQFEAHLRSHNDSHAQWLHESRRNGAFLYTGTRGEGQPNPPPAQQSQRPQARGQGIQRWKTNHQLYNSSSLSSLFRGADRDSAPTKPQITLTRAQGNPGNCELQVRSSRQTDKHRIICF